MLPVIASVLFTAVGAVAALMTWRCLGANRLLPFHQRPIGRSWAELSSGEQAVAQALTRSLGLGFLVAALALFGAAATALTHPTMATYCLAGLGLVFCVGLAVINRRLHASASVETPWRGAIYLSAAVAIGIALCAFA